MSQIAEQLSGYLRTVDDVRYLLHLSANDREAKERLIKELRTNILELGEQARVRELELADLRKEQCRLRRNLLVLDELKSRLERTGLVPGWLRAKMEGAKR